MVGSMSPYGGGTPPRREGTMEKPSKGLVSRMRQFRGGGENQEDDEMKTPMLSLKRLHETRVDQKISFTMDQKILDTAQKTIRLL